MHIELVVSGALANPLHTELGRELDNLFRSSQFLPSHFKGHEYLLSFAKDNAAERHVLAFARNEHSELCAALMGRIVFDSADIDYIVVSPECQRQGVASKLLACFEKLCRQGGAQRILLEVSEKNETALAFYRRNGFNEIAARRSYYRAQEDARVMEKVL